MAVNDGLIIIQGGPKAKTLADPKIVEVECDMLARANTPTERLFALKSMLKKQYVKKAVVAEELELPADFCLMRALAALPADIMQLEVNMKRDEKADMGGRMLLERFVNADGTVGGFVGRNISPKPEHIVRCRVHPGVILLDGTSPHDSTFKNAVVGEECSIYGSSLAGSFSGGILVGRQVNFRNATLDGEISVCDGVQLEEVGAKGRIAIGPNARLAGLKLDGTEGALYVSGNIDGSLLRAGREIDTQEQVELAIKLTKEHGELLEKYVRPMMAARRDVVGGEISN
jgi:hypothetical protein